MTEDGVQKLIDKNFQLVTILGASLPIMQAMMDSIPWDGLPSNCLKSYEWYKKAIENVVYLGKPLPPMYEENPNV